MIRVPIFFPTVAPDVAFIVSGAGASIVNGNYFLEGENSYANGSGVIAALNGNGAWSFSDDENEYYFSPFNTLTYPSRVFNQTWIFFEFDEQPSFTITDCLWNVDTYRYEFTHEEYGDCYLTVIFFEEETGLPTEIQVYNGDGPVGKADVVNLHGPNPPTEEVEFPWFLEFIEIGEEGTAPIPTITTP